jgi:Flp pilus assembly protein TadD
MHKEPGPPNRSGETNRKTAAPFADWRKLLVGGGLIIATVAVYGQVLSHQFINLDDDKYIYENPMVTAGLSAKGVAWAFTTFHASNWHPLTWLSHMLDVQMFGLSPGPHLAVNVFFHLLNTLLVLVVLLRMTNRLWRSALVAALFALHPMHVESVAWAAERKDVLSAFFALLSLLAYVRYTQSAAPNWRRFLPVTLLLAFSLLAKPMFVTWPFVLLLLDYWPLNRLRWSPEDGLALLGKRLAPLAREKISLFLLVAASMVITYVAQSRGGAVRAFTDAPLSLRLLNAAVSYGRYLFTLVWPAKLGVYYPFSSDGIPIWLAGAAVALIGFVTVAAIRLMRARGYLITGWAWYLGTLVPVIGLVQVGGQAMADRYSYIPSIGLFVAVVWGVSDFVSGGRVQLRAAAAIAIVWLTTIGALAWVQVGFWRDSVTLYRHTLMVAPDNNVVVHFNLAHVLGKQGNLNEAVTHFSEALRSKPDFFDALINIGVTLNDQRRFAEATDYLTRAVAIEPGSSKAHAQLAIALAQNGRNDEALKHFYQAVELAPNDPDARTNLGLMLARQGKLEEAEEQLNGALQQNPNSPEAHNNLGWVLLLQGHPEKSIEEFSTALRLKPDFKLAQENLNRAQAQLRPGRE